MTDNIDYDIEGMYVNVN